MIRNQRGFTLIEMIVVMAVFMTVLMISASSFNTILAQASKVFRSEESNIEGVIGLEMLRHDLQQAGYGLFSEPATYTNEAAIAEASVYNDAPNNVPRPIVGGNDLAGKVSGANTIMEGSDYLAIKGTTVGREKAAQKWTFLQFSSSIVFPHKWPSTAENLSSPDKVVLIQKQFGTPPRSSLVRDPAGDFYYAYSDIGFKHLSSASTGIYTAYGVDKSNILRFPFNRSDYFVARPATTPIPSYCAPNTGILYKTTVNHNDGGLTYIPVLDCVLDMQVVLGWDWDNNGIIDTYSNADGTVANGGLVMNASAALSQTNNNSITLVPNIRTNLKMIKVYIVAQNGKKDSGYTSASPLTFGDVTNDPGIESLTRSAGFPLAADQLNYRWKVYRVVVRPKNLLANQ